LASGTDNIETGLLEIRLYFDLKKAIPVTGRGGL
jgi:hypothetical protein